MNPDHDAHQTSIKMLQENWWNLIHAKVFETSLHPNPQSAASYKQTEKVSKQGILVLHTLNEDIKEENSHAYSYVMLGDKWVGTKMLKVFKKV